jgi:transcriptional regulator with XRE-family HTH domain
MPPPHLGDLVRALREDRGLSLRELARRSNVDISTLSRLESHIHATMTRENLARVSQTLGVSVAEIERQLGSDNDDPPPRRRWPTLEEVVNRDKELTQIQREALIAHYRSYVHRR